MVGSKRGSGTSVAPGAQGASDKAARKYVLCNRWAARSGHDE